MGQPEYLDYASCQTESHFTEWKPKEQKSSVLRLKDGFMDIMMTDAYE